MSLMADPTACFNGDFFYKTAMILNRMLRIPEWRAFLTSGAMFTTPDKKFDVLVKRIDTDSMRASVFVSYAGAERYFMLSFYPNLGRIPQIGMEELFPIFGYVENPIPRDEIVKMLNELVVIPDNMLSERSLEDRWVDKNGGYHPTHTVETWQSLVASNMTRDGYWKWVYQALRMEGLEQEPPVA